jgi:hypothetical protein
MTSRGLAVWSGAQTARSRAAINQRHGHVPRLTNGGHVPRLN